MSDEIKISLITHHLLLITIIYLPTIVPPGGIHYAVSDGQRNPFEGLAGGNEELV